MLNQRIEITPVTDGVGDVLDAVRQIMIGQDSSPASTSSLNITNEKSLPRNAPLQPRKQWGTYPLELL